MLMSPGALKFSAPVVFEKGSVLSASSLAKGLTLSDDQICMMNWLERRDPENAFKGTIMNNFDYVGTESYKVAYVGETSATVRIGVICNKDVDALREDIEVHSSISPALKAAFETAIKKNPALAKRYPHLASSKFCKICEDKGKCCVVFLKRV